MIDDGEDPDQVLEEINRELDGLLRDLRWSASPQCCGGDCNCHRTGTGARCLLCLALAKAKRARAEREEGDG